jgi:LPS O-antigen subunit length determinant protein (WzzB/FepE family)
VDEETRLARMLALGAHLWSRKRVIAIGTLAGAVLGAVYALLAPDVFVSSAVIYPKEISADVDRSMLGSGFGKTLNPLAGVSHLNRVEIILNSPELAMTVIREQSLLPVLFPGRWDAAQKRWKDVEPAVHEGIGPLTSLLSTRVDSYKLILEVRTRAGDAKTAHRLLGGYLKALNERMKQTVIRDAEANQEYLESQLVRTYDPWIKDKIQQLILSQIEKGMLLNANAFEVLVEPTLPRDRESPRRVRVVLSFGSLAFILSCGTVLLAAAVRNRKTAARRA